MMIRHDWADENTGYGEGYGENMKSVRGIIVGALITCAMAAPAFAQDAVGKWTGVVKTPGGDLPIIFVVTKDTTGKLGATLESPLQAPGMLLVADKAANDGDTLSLTFEKIQGAYKATWNGETKTWTGTWTQIGTPMPLNMTQAAP
jgi:hypothetical protein